MTTKRAIILPRAETLKTLKCDHCGKTAKVVQYATELYQRPARKWTMPPLWMYVQLCQTESGLVNQGWHDPCDERVDVVFCSEACCDQWFTDHNVQIGDYGKWTWIADWGEREIIKVATDDN